MSYIAYLGTDSVRGSQGIYTLALDEAGQPTILGTTPAQDSGYLCLSRDGKHLYAAIESMVLDGRPNGGVGDYRIGADHLPVLVRTLPANGQLICHMSCDDNFVYASSYLNGTVTVYPIGPDGCLGEACHTIRHEASFGLDPHIHCAKPTADGKQLCVVEVGYHALCLYAIGSWEKVCQVPTKPVRPRQVVCTDGFVYLITEGGKTVDTYAYAPRGAEPLRLLQSLDALPPEKAGMGASGGIRRYGNALFGAIRGADLIAMFARDPVSGLLTWKSATPVGGACPRDFNLTPDGRFLLVGLQKADRMAVFAVDYDKYTLSAVAEGILVPSCSCVEFAGAEGGKAQ